MSEILIKAVSATHIDSIKDRRGCYKKGYPVLAMPDGHEWGNKETLPRFVIVKCPELTLAQASQYCQEWQDDFGYEVLNNNPTQGKYTIRIYELNKSLSGYNQITLSKVENYLSSWGCDNIVYNSGVVFDFSLWKAIQSDNFWEVVNIDDYITFTLLGYDATLGIGRVQIELPSTYFKYSQSQIIKRIESVGGEIISDAHPIYVFDISRSDIFTKFKQDTKTKVESRYCRRRYYFSESQIDNIISSGGSVVVTKNQLLNAINDKLSE